MEKQLDHQLASLGDSKRLPPVSPQCNQCEIHIG